MSLIATKSEVAEVAALLEQGADSPTELAKTVIRKITEMREERKVYALVLELSPGVYSGYGPFATIDATFNSVDKNPMAYIAKRGAVVPLLGHGPAVAAMHAKTDEPPADQNTFNIVREDALAVKNGWKGNVRDRDRFLHAST